MKKIITNFVLLIFCSIPRLVKGQMGIARFNVNTEEKLLAPTFIENIAFTQVTDLPAALPGGMQTPLNENLINPDVLEVDDIEKISLCQVKFAMMLDVEVESIKNTILYKFIENWFGTRYRLGGSTKRGIDCSAFTDSLLSAVYNLLVPRTAREQYKNCERICREDLLEGDLVFFNTRGGVSHVGLYLANGRFVHSSASRGVTISSLSDKYFSRRFIGAGRVQGD